MYKVAVLMASFNGEKYIKQQIESVLNQKNVEVELLVRDDGSTDKTQEILQHYAKDHKLKWYTGKHLNVAKSFLELIKNAPEADYYAFCDQDDIWLERKLEKAISILTEENRNQPLMYYSSTTLVNNTLEHIGQHIIRTKRNDLARFFFNDMSGNTIVLNSIFKGILEKTANYDIRIHDKWALQLCLAIGGKCCGDKESYILYRQHTNNTIGMELSFRDKIKKFLNVINEPKDIHLTLLNNFSGSIISPYNEVLRIVNKEKISLRDKGYIIRKVKFGDCLFKLAFVLRVLKGNI